MPFRSSEWIGPENASANASSLPASAGCDAAPARSETDSSFRSTDPILKLCPVTPA